VKRFSLPLVILICLLIVGCAQSETNVQATIEVAVAQTQEASSPGESLPSETATLLAENLPSPIPTESPTSTPIPSATATSTATNTSTPTPTSTPKPTETPKPTATPPGPLVNINSEGYALNAPTQDGKTNFKLSAGTTVGLIERSEDGQWYKVQLLSREQSGWLPISSVDLTEEVIIDDLPIATLVPTPTNTPDVRGEYSEIDIREIDSYTSSYIGDKVKLRGEVFNVLGDGLQMWVRKPGGSSYDTIAVVVTWDSRNILPDQVYEDTWITVYGVVSGTFEGTNSYGGTISQPMIEADIIEKG
jgi:hypothetical protein